MNKLEQNNFIQFENPEFALIATQAIRVAEVLMDCGSMNKSNNL